MCACTHPQLNVLKQLNTSSSFLNFLQAAAATTTLFVAHYISIWQAHFAFSPGDNNELQGLGM
jgi:hypothetical protein